MSYTTIRAAILAKVRTALGAGWTVGVGARQGDIDLDLYGAVDRLVLLLPSANELLPLVELGGSLQEGWRQWILTFGVRYQPGREAEADLILQTALEAVRDALAGECLDSDSGPLERTVETNISEDTIRLTWTQGWRHERYPG